jgi:hypothetical protein
VTSALIDSSGAQMSDEDAAAIEVARAVARLMEEESLFFYGAPIRAGLKKLVDALHSNGWSHKK